MMKHLLVALVVASGCYVPEESTQTSALEGDGLVFQTLTDNDVVGVYETGVGIATFKATRSGDDIDARIDIDGADIQLSVRTEGHDAATVGLRVTGDLDKLRHELLVGLHEQLMVRWPYPNEGDSFDPTPPHVSLVRTYVGVLSEGPAMKLPPEWIYSRITLKERLEQLKKPRPVDPTPTPTPTPGECQRDDDDGVVALLLCCGGGQNMAWQHDADHCFRTDVNWCGMDSTPATDPTLGTTCPGRCGPGCGALPGYYQDCLDHDLCVQHEGVDAVSVTNVCGDELREAVDDTAWSWTVWSISWLGGGGCG